MAQFQVPQFIDTEPKIVGPLTLKQFGYVGIAGMISFFLFFTLRLEIWLIITAVLGVIAASFAFLKFNGRPFEVLFMNFVWFIWKPRLYLWQRKDVMPTMPNVPTISSMRPANTSRVKTLWLGLVTKRPAELPTPSAPSAPLQTTSTPTPVVPVHQVPKGETGSGAPQMLRDIKKRKQEQGY